MGGFEEGAQKGDNTTIKPLEVTDRSFVSGRSPSIASRLVIRCIELQSQQSMPLSCQSKTSLKLEIS